ncbi:MAG: dTDP-4-dehydrorhamnose reductase [Myxococcota bacterium]
MTGAGGQLGRSLVAEATRRGLAVSARTHETLDISDERAVARSLEEVGPSIVVNCAAFTQVDACEIQPEAAERANALAPGVLARACGRSVRLVHLSTEYVFSGRASRPFRESSRTAPLSVYGRSKLAGELRVREASQDHLVVRTQWLFGPGRNFVRTIAGAARRGEALRVVEDQLGRPTWTGALAGGILDAVQGGARGILHLACDGVASWFDLALAVVCEGVRRGWHGPVSLEPVATRQLPRPARRPAYGVLGLERARALGLGLGHWRAALRNYLDREDEAERA